MAEEKRTRPPRKKPERVPRQAMPVRPPEVRVRDFNEVATGFTKELALIEAKRCLQCPKQPCVDGCPVSVDITGFIHLVAEGDFIGAAQKIKETNLLPAVCGRVCPRKNNVNRSVWSAKSTNRLPSERLERFVADYEREHGRRSNCPNFNLNRQKSGGSGFWSGGYYRIL